MRIGYARVSTQDQNLEMQCDALHRAGCDRIYQDRCSAAGERPGRAKLRAGLSAGDTLVVWKLDRLGRSVIDLVSVLRELNENGVEFVSLTESLDTSTAAGRMLYGVIAVVAEFERDLLRERTQAGLHAARARGRCGGRPRSLSEEQVSQARTLLAGGQHSVRQVCETLGASKSTLYRALQRP